MRQSGRMLQLLSTLIMGKQLTARGIKAPGLRPRTKVAQDAQKRRGSTVAKLPPSLPMASKLPALRGRRGGCVVGVDEAGRGPWAGPVVAAAVTAGAAAVQRTAGVTDSKKLSEAQREAVFAELTSDPDIRYEVVVVGRERIDRTNILAAAHEAMAKAVKQLQKKLPQAQRGAVLVDGNLIPKQLESSSCKAVVGGDRTCFEIAAASVLAKVTRDRHMRKLHNKFPDYGFDSHKGYGTAAHQAALQRLGPCTEHRTTFQPLKGFLATGEWKQRGKRTAKKPEPSNA